MQNLNWLNKIEYPFTLHSFPASGGNMNYIDEGNGDTLVFVHGTPEWSFSFRNVIKILSKKFRCIAVDHLGFGLSDKNQVADYSVKAHAERLEFFISSLHLKNIVLIGGDFGGAMALHYAIKHPENVRSIALWNTWMWNIMHDKHFSGPAKLINTWLGEFMYKKLNAPVNMIMPQAYGDKRKLTKEIHKHYKMPLNNSASRIATYTIARQLKDAGSWWDKQWGDLKRIEHLPFLFLWGMKDKFLPTYLLEKWKQRLSKAKVIEIKKAGHFVHEEEPEIFAQEIRKFIGVN
ncbi:MAG: alpha/beta fold hydrolase [Fimbriimonadaceae bacterium]|nr:alpha/beta fold hydrolase [Chitinophagales bacterium]